MNTANDKKYALSFEEISKMPFFKRQLISIIPDDILNDPEIATKILADNETKNDVWSDFVNAAGTLARSLWTLKKSYDAAIYVMAMDAYRSIFRAAKKGLPVQAVSSSASKEFIFPPGHPRIDTVYGCHPANERKYYPLADFHRVVFEDKFSEAMRLLMALGASNIKIQQVDTNDSGLSGDLALDIPTQAGTLSPKVSFENESTRRDVLLFEANLARRHDPVLPSDFVWYHHEPTWISICEGRLKYGLDSFSLIVAYKDDYGINAKLAASINSIGMSIGGDFQGHRSIVRRISGSFSAVGVK